MPNAQSHRYFHTPNKSWYLKISFISVLFFCVSAMCGFFLFIYYQINIFYITSQNQAIYSSTRFFLQFL